MLVFEQHPRTGDFQLRNYESGEVVTSFLEDSDDADEPSRPNASWHRFNGQRRRYNFQTREVEDID